VALLGNATQRGGDPAARVVTRYDYGDVHARLASPPSIGIETSIARAILRLTNSTA
jgi:hypothetical protein